MVCKAEAAWPAAECAGSASAEDVLRGFDGCAATNGWRPLLPVAGASHILFPQRRQQIER